MTEQRISIDQLNWKPEDQRHWTKFPFFLQSFDQSIFKCSVFFLKSIQYRDAATRMTLEIGEHAARDKQENMLIDHRQENWNSSFFITDFIVKSTEISDEQCLNSMKLKSNRTATIDIDSVVNEVFCTYNRNREIYQWKWFEDQQERRSMHNKDSHCDNFYLSANSTNKMRKNWNYICNSEKFFGLRQYWRERLQLNR